MRSVRSFPLHKLRIIKRRFVQKLDNHSVATLKKLKKHKQVCLYLLENLRKKEFMVSKLARGLSPIVKLQFFLSGFRFILRIARLNSHQVFTMWFLGSSYHCVIYIFTAICMI